MKYRLALNMGSTFLGWCILATDEYDAPSSIIDMGVRIFSDGRDNQSKKPLAAARRSARALRRNHDRRDRRQRRLLSCLIKYGLMPQNRDERKMLESLDPYELRAKALDHQVSLHELGRAIFHINQRRGFKSNLKKGNGSNEASNLKNAIKSLDSKLMVTSSRTLGEYLWKEHKERQPVRVRSQIVHNKAEYNFYPSRDMYVNEINTIFEKQKVYHSVLTNKVCNEIKDIIFYQRPLKTIQLGTCRFESGEKRARMAYPIVQKFRILKEVNNLQIERLLEDAPEITPEDRMKIVETLLNNKKRTFGQIRTLLKFSRDCRFNLESEDRADLEGDITSNLLSDRECFGNKWYLFSAGEQERIIDLLFESQDSDLLVEKLISDYGVTFDQAEEIANAALPEGYCVASKKAIEKMMPFLDQGMEYSNAARSANYTHSEFQAAQTFEHLPYYGEILPNNVSGGSYLEFDKPFPEKFYGKISNPSVHIALNQARKLVNALIDKYGHPEELVIGLARDLIESPDEISKNQSRNFKENERINKELILLGVKTNYRNRALFKLWEDLAEDQDKRCCPFSGVQILKNEIFSGNFEAEHLLPFSHSYNDGRANKVLSSRSSNSFKGNRTPFEAFSHTAEWPQILARAQNLPKNKRWRFQADAWNIAKGKGQDIIASILNDPRHMPRIAKAYLAAIFDSQERESKIWAISSQMTALLRDKWGLNDLLNEDERQNITDHRHHAIDAFVIGCSDRGTFEKLADAAKRLEGDKTLYEKRHKLVSKMPEPFYGFYEQMTKNIQKIVISYKPDHGGAFKAIRTSQPYTVAPLHKETAYGLVEANNKKESLTLTTRIAIESLENRRHIEEVADPVIRENLRNIMDGIKEKSTEWKSALSVYSQKSGTRRVRIRIEKKQDSMVGISQPIDRGPEANRDTPYKFYELRGNYCAEIYCTVNGRQAGEWQCEIIPNYYAHQKDFIPKWRKNNPTAKLIMRLQIDDMVAYEKDGITTIARVKKMTSGFVHLRPHSIAKEVADKLSWMASARQMQLKNTRKISVDIIGRVRDPKKVKSTGGD